MSKVIKGIAIAAAIVFTGGALAIGLGMTGGFLAGFLTAVNSLALSAFVNGVTAQLAGGGGNAAAQTATMEYTGTVEPRRIVYGQQRLSGMNVLPPVTSGTNNRYLHQVLVLAGHEVNAITDVYFGQDLIDSASIGAISGTASDGLVSSGAYAGKAWIRRMTGTASQAADFILDSSLSIWTSSHNGYGVSYLALQYDYSETVYKSGKPEVTCIVQGMKVYDPRLDSTNGGSGSQRLATPSTWVYSANPALCLADYLTNDTLGMGESSSRVDWAMVANAADHCDEMAICPTASTQKRYTCNVVLFGAAAYQDNIATIVGSMLGSCLYSGGKWRIKAGVWDAVEFSLGDSNIINGGAEFTTAYAYKDRWNGIRGSFIDPANNYQANEFPATQNATYVSADGESVFKDVQFTACTNVYEAQRAAVLLTRKSRNAEVASLRCDMSAWKIRPGMTGIVSVAELGWSNKTVRCEGWKFSPDGHVEIIVREELSSDWNDPIETDYTTPLAISNPVPAYYTPDPPSGLVVTSTTNAIYLSWIAPAVMPYSAQYEVWEYTAATPFSSATKVWSGTSTNCTLPKTDTIVRYYWVLVRMPDGTASATYPPSAGTNGSAGTIFYGMLTVPSVSLSADSSGVVASYASATGTFQTFSAGVDVTTAHGVVYGLTSATGCTATINTSTGVYSVSAMSTDNATAVFSATYNAITIAGTMSLSKSRSGAGSSVPVAYLTKPSVDLMAYANGTVQSFTPAAGNIKVMAGGADVTGSSTFAVTLQTNCTGTVNSSGAYSVTAMSADTASLTMTATYSGTTFTLIFALALSRVGYEIVATLPSTSLFQGRIVFLTTDNKLYRYSGSAWTIAVDGADITASSILTNSIGAGQITGAKVATNTLTAANIDTRSLTIKDASGNVIFGSGAGINPSSYMSVPTGWLNSNVTISSGGALSGAGGGAVTISGLDSTVVRSANPITSGNISTYISGAIIGSAYIADLAVSTLKIADQSVSTFQSYQDIIYNSGSSVISVYMSYAGTITFFSFYRPFGTFGSGSSTNSSISESTSGLTSTFSSPFTGATTGQMTRIHNMTVPAYSAGWYYFTLTSTCSGISGTYGGAFDTQLLVRYK